MAGALLRTAGGTLLYVFFLWLVRIDDYQPLQSCAQAAWRA